MPNTKLTKEKIKNHFQYSKWIYLVVALVAGFMGDLLFTVTAYRAPNERKVDIELVSSYADAEALRPVAQRALEAGVAYERARDAERGVDVDAQDYEPALQEVNFISVGYDENSDDAYYGAQKYMVMLAAQEGDIYILNRGMMEQLVDQGLACDLLPYIESGLIDPGERDLSRVTYPEHVEAEDGEKPTGRTCVYALQTETMTGLWEYGKYDPVDKYMVIMAYSQNQDTAAAVMGSLIGQLEEVQAEAEAQ